MGERSGDGGGKKPPEVRPTIRRPEGPRRRRETITEGNALSEAMMGKVTEEKLRALSLSDLSAVVRVLEKELGGTSLNPNQRKAVFEAYDLASRIKLYSEDDHTGVDIQAIEDAPTSAVKPPGPRGTRADLGPRGPHGTMVEPLGDVPALDKGSEQPKTLAEVEQRMIAHFMGATEVSLGVVEDLITEKFITDDEGTLRRLIRSFTSVLRTTNDLEVVATMERGLTDPGTDLQAAIRAATPGQGTRRIVEGLLRSLIKIRRIELESLSLKKK